MKRKRWSLMMLAVKPTRSVDTSSIINRTTIMAMPPSPDLLVMTSRFLYEVAEKVSLSIAGVASGRLLGIPIDERQAPDADDRRQVVADVIGLQGRERIGSNADMQVHLANL